MGATTQARKALEQATNLLAGRPLAILIPLMRREKLEPLYHNICENTQVPFTVEVAADRTRIPAKYIPDGCNVTWDKGASYARRINRLALHSTAPYWFLGADDIWFHRGWDLHACRAMESVDGVVAVTDLLNSNGTHSLVSRNYVTTLSGTMDGPKGRVLHPQYRHCWVDVEQFETAKVRGRFVPCPESVVEHLHPAAGKADTDWVYKIAELAYAKDRRIFESRRHLWGGAGR